MKITLIRHNSVENYLQIGFCYGDQLLMIVRILLMYILLTWAAALIYTTIPILVRNGARDEQLLLQFFNQLIINDQLGDNSTII